MKHVIHIFGASGSGTTTLGKALSERLGFTHLDTDDVYWVPTNPPFTTGRPPEERLRLIRQRIDEAQKGMVWSGSVGNWIQPLLPAITLAVRLVADTELRLQRIRDREYARFGQRIRPGGDMAEKHQEFLRWAALYDEGPETGRSRAKHDQFAALLSCPVLVLDGGDTLENKVNAVVNKLMELQEGEKKMNAAHPMRRFKQALSREVCEEVLARGTSGVLALHGDDGYPYAVPLSYLYVDGRLVFHCAKVGYKIDCVRKNCKASFCVVDQDEIIPEEYTTYFRSVICRGQVRILEDRQEIMDLCTALGEKYRPGHPQDSRAAVENAMNRLGIMVMDVEEMTGKEARELMERRGTQA